MGFPYALVLKSVDDEVYHKSQMCMKRITHSYLEQCGVEVFVASVHLIMRICHL